MLRLFAVLFAFTSILTGFAETPVRGSLIGTVGDGTGSTIAAEITAYRLVARGGQIELSVECSTSLHADGTFTCEAVSPGSYVIVVMPTRQAQTASQLSKLPTFALYPAAGTLNRSSLLHVASGEVSAVDIRIVPGLVSKVSGMPASANSEGRIVIFANGEDFTIPLNNMSLKMEEHGFSLAGLPEGNFVIQDEWNTNGRLRRSSGFVTVKAGHQNRVMLIEGHSNTIKGTVQTLDQLSPAGNLTLEGVVAGRSVRLFAPISHDGSFVFPPVEDGVYRIGFALDERGLFPETVMAGGNRVEGNRVTIGPMVDDLEWTLQGKSSSSMITGVVDSSPGCLRPGVVIQSVDSRMSRVLQADANGMFVLHQLSPGQYRLFGWNDISSIPYNDSRFLADFVESSTLIDVSEASAISGVRLACNTSSL